MNERIRLLALQAGATTTQRSGWIDYGTLDLDVEKFAELIVKECAEISEQSQWSEAKGEYYEGFNEAMIYVSNKIKLHFGLDHGTEV
jgi:hypothetical protein